MSDVSKDSALNMRLRHDQPGRRFVTNDDVRWGELVLPAPGENPDKGDSGMRVVALTSFPFGYLVLETVKAYECRFPGRLNLVGVITDDPVNSDARISLRKRIWNFVDPEHRLEIETATVEAGLSFGVPAYTGEIKNDWFRSRLREWRPDVILCCGFGQILDRPMLDLPSIGVYNFHPSDLAHSRGAGPAPFDAVKARNATTSCWTVHRMIEAVDQGPIVGSSPPIRVTDEDGALPEHPLPYYNKMADGLDHMVAAMLDALTETHGSRDPQPVEHVPFDDVIPDRIKQRMMAPARDQRLRVPLPTPDRALFD